MRRLPPLLSRLLAFTLLAACCAIGFLLVVVPLHQRHAELDQSIAAAQELLQRFAIETADPSVLQHQRDALAASNAAAADGLLRGNNETLAGAFLQSFLNTTVERAGGTIRSIQVLPVREDRQLRRVAARAQLEATATGLRDILHRLESADPYLFVSALDIRTVRQARGDENGTKDTELLIRFDVHGYLTAEPPVEEQS